MSFSGRVNWPPLLGSSLHVAKSERIESLIDKQIKMDMNKDRREARRNARLRCRARDLMEAAEEQFPENSREEAVVCKGRTDITLRPITPLELGLMYSWMAEDEKSVAARAAPRHAHKDDDDPDEDDDDPPDVAEANGTTAPSAARAQMAVTRWWTGGATGLQETWEASMGWFDEADTGAPHQGDAEKQVVRRPAGSGVENLKETLRIGGASSASRQLGSAAARNAAAPGSPAQRYLEGKLDAAGGSLGPHFLGAFASGQLVGFVATKSYPPDKLAAARRPAGSEWIIDAMGTRLSHRGCSIGTVLAEECLVRCKAAARKAAIAKARSSLETSPQAGSAATPTDRTTQDVDGAHEPSPAFAYRIDVVPSAVGFWQKLGFELEEPTGEQAYYAERGGDLPMLKLLPL